MSGPGALIRMLATAAEHDWDITSTRLEDDPQVCQFGARRAFPEVDGVETINCMWTQPALGGAWLFSGGIRKIEGFVLGSVINLTEHLTIPDTHEHLTRSTAAACNGPMPLAWTRAHEGHGILHGTCPDQLHPKENDR